MALPKVFNRAPGNYDPVEAGEVDTIKDYGPSMTVQSDSEEADINTIVRRFGLTGQLPNNMSAPVYADFEGIYDFHTAQNAIAEAHSTFMKLPAAIRARFDNDPQELMEFVDNPDNYNEAVKLGLANARKPEEPKETAQGRTTGTPPGGEPREPGTAQQGSGSGPAK